MTLGCEYFERGAAVTVTYDSKALVIDGERRVLLSGSLHYPRATPEVWPDLIRKCKEGGLDVIETYVFWNSHEPEQGKYYFEDRFDLVRFVKTVHEAGLYVHLRIGPYACAEWNYGGFPMWLHFIPGIQFRTNNAPFKNEMERFLTKIVTLMKDENLFASQGGPIILSQVENEYGNVEWAYGIAGELYVKWAASTAIALNTSVPWVMCSQEDAPDPIINTCNGFYCDTFAPNSPSKPKMWTENYPGWFLAFGYAIPYRPVEDLAFSVARFFETGGTLQNYYMYFGGTNWGHTAGGPLVATSYDYDAPIDEYGLIREPKWGHLRDLHKSIKLCEKPLVNYDAIYISLGLNLEAHVYNGTSSCAAFLANIDHSSDANVSFNGNSYLLPAWSVSILPDCKSVIYNTAKVVSQKSFTSSLHKTKLSPEHDLKSSNWEWFKEQVGTSVENSFTRTGLLEQINTTRDRSDYLWYTISIDSHVDENEVLLNLESLGHAALLFVNNELEGFGYGNHDDASFTMNKKIKLNRGNNSIDLLSMIVGIQNYGPWFDIQGAGIFLVTVADLEHGLENLSTKEWTYQVGTEGEYLGLYKMDAINSSLWTSGSLLPTNQSLIWYKTSFIAPGGSGPVAIDLSSMGKGEAWVNGISIGRYWSAYLAPSDGCTDNCDYRGPYDSNKCLKNCGKPAQTVYHVPRTWVNSANNVLVLHEEQGGNPSKITVLTKTGQELCARISELDPPPIESWKPNSTFESTSPQVRLSCERGWHIASIHYANFGTNQGECGQFIRGNCRKNVLTVVQEACVGSESCSVAVSSDRFGDPCPGIDKTLAVEAICTK